MILKLNAKFILVACQDPLLGVLNLEVPYRSRTVAGLGKVLTEDYVYTY